MSGNTPVYDLIDDLHYSYAPGANPVLNAFSSKLQGVDDMVTNTAAQPYGVFLESSGYGYDDNGNMISAGSISAEYNILNLPTVLSTSSGERKFEYVFGGGKYSAELTGNPTVDEMRHYLGGMEFKNGVLEAYNFGDGRVVFHDSVPTLRFQYRLADHLGNTVVFFEDKNNNGCITTEEEATGPADLEIIQRLLYYPFGMALEGLGAWNAQPWQQYRYNGKERDTLTGWYEYGARWAIMEIGGRFVSIDPLTEKMPGWSPYSYGFDNPVQYTDPTGMEPEGDCCPGVKKVVDRYVDRNVGILTGAASEAWNAVKYGVREAILPGSMVRDGINLARNYDQIIPGIKGSFQEGYRIMTEGTDYEQGQLTGRIGFNFGLALVGGEGALLSRAPGMINSGRTSLFRAVSQAELDDIANFGLRNSSGYETGKLFATSAQDASNYGRLNFGFDNKPFSIIKTSISSEYKPLMYQSEMDLMKAVSVPSDLLGKMSKPTVLKSTPLPNHPWIK